MQKITKLAALAVLVAFGVNCGGGDSNDPDEPTPGNLTVSLATPNTDDAAIKLTITGPVAPSAITSAGGTIRLFQSGAIGTTTTVVLTGDIVDGALLTITVPDTRDAADYSATVVQVASTDYVIRANTGYTLSVDE